MIIAQITDLHVRPRGVLAYGSVDTNAMLRRAVAAIAALDPAPDGVIASGDLADCGLEDEYREIIGHGMNGAGAERWLSNDCAHPTTDGHDHLHEVVWTALSTP